MSFDGSGGKRLNSNNIMARAQRTVGRSKQVSPSTKRPKTSRGMAVFGTSSQFKGIGRGRKGDPRR